MNFPSPQLPTWPQYPSPGLPHGYHTPFGSTEGLFDYLLYVLSNWNGVDSFFQLLELLSAWRLWG